MAVGLGHVSSEAFPINYKSEATQVKYTGTIYNEPKFNMQSKKKEKADYMQSTMSMSLKVPIQKSAFIMQLNDYPNTPYSRTRAN